MAIVRIYLCTYRRNALLPRAIKALQQQTLTDWICELHNDDPQDPFPQQWVSQLNDPRIIVVNHETNWGAMRVFNWVFRPAEEEFVSLLEDDNWWEPTFLETMVNTLRSHPEVNVAWANMQFCQEQDNGVWEPLKNAIWDIDPAQETQLFYFPDRRQIFGALHSQGAMVVRSRTEHPYLIPNSTTSAAGEHVRERCFDYPIAFVPQILGNYALTKDTSRSHHRATWNAIQILLGGSFLSQVPLQAMTLAGIWADARARLVSSTSILFWIAWLYPSCRGILKYATGRDWLNFGLRLCKRPGEAYETYQLVHQQRELRRFLDTQTAARVQAAQTLGFTAL